ncbi:MAG: hypothetical protein ACPG8W_12080 [Candidatus Promineifilaceae bacterium]
MKKGETLRNFFVDVKSILARAVPPLPFGLGVAVAVSTQTGQNFLLSRSFLCYEKGRDLAKFFVDVKSILARVVPPLPFGWGVVVAVSTHTGQNSLLSHSFLCYEKGRDLAKFVFARAVPPLPFGLGIMIVLSTQTVQKICVVSPLFKVNMIEYELDHRAIPMQPY